MKLKITGTNKKLAAEKWLFDTTKIFVKEFGLPRHFLNAFQKSKTKQETNQVYSPKDLLTAQQSASILGLSSKTLANWRTSGKNSLKYTRIGGAIRYQYSDIIAFTDSNKRLSTSSKEQSAGKQHAK